MKYSKRLFVIWGVILSMLFSCKDTFEEDISAQKVILNTPQDGYRFFNPNISFWWEPINGAYNYNIQIIQIDTNQNNAQICLITDSNITNNKFLQTLYPGSYKWGVKAFNGGYQTDYTYQIFHIDSSLDLSNVFLVLTMPVNNYVTNDSNFTFSWQDLYNADYYSWELRTPNEDGNLISVVSDITTNSLNVNINNEGNYAWTVYAHNNLTNTDSKKTWRSITIDKTNPNPPDLISPLNNDTLYNIDLIENKIKFSWKQPDDNGSELMYTIYIASDSSFNNELVNTTISDTVYLWALNNIYSKFFWRVKTIDMAGNESDYCSEQRTFWYINQ